MAIIVAGLFVGDGICRLAVGGGALSRSCDEELIEPGELTWREKRRERKARKKEERKETRMMDAAAMLWVYGFTIYLISLAVEMAFNFDLQDSLFFDFGDSFWFCVLMTLGCFVVAAVKREV